MQWSIDDLGHDVWQITLSGEFTVADYFLIIEEIQAMDRHVLHRLWDLRNVDMRRASSSDMQQIVNHIRGAYPQDRPGKTAHLVTRGLTFGLSRMVGSYAEDTPRQLRVFTDRGEALKWLVQDD